MAEWDERVEAAALKLWEIGNERIGHREWEAVEDHYTAEAQAALSAAGVPLLMRQRDVAWTKAHEIAESCVAEFAGREMTE